jgi:hypothetical protein
MALMSPSSCEGTNVLCRECHPSFSTKVPLANPDISMTRRLCRCTPGDLPRSSVTRACRIGAEDAVEQTGRCEIRGHSVSRFSVQMLVPGTY